jgi:hypothetical protein
MDALRIKRAIGYQRGIAYDLAGLSQISEAENDLENARKEQEEALAIRNKIGEKHNAAQSMLGLAALRLEEGNPAEAEALAVQATEQLKSQSSPADEADGQIVLAAAGWRKGNSPRHKQRSDAPPLGLVAAQAGRCISICPWFPRI